MNNGYNYNPQNKKNKNQDIGLNNQNPNLYQNPQYNQQNPQQPPFYGQQNQYPPQNQYNPQYPPQNQYNPQFAQNQFNNPNQYYNPNQRLSNNMPNPGFGNNMPNPGFGNNMPNQDFGNHMPNQGFGNNMPNQGFGNNMPNQGFGNNMQNQGFGNHMPNQGFGQVYGDNGMKPDESIHDINFGMDNLNVNKDKFNIYSDNYGIGASLFPGNDFFKNDNSGKGKNDNSPTLSQIFNTKDIPKINTNNFFGKVNNMEDYWKKKKQDINYFDALDDINKIIPKKINIFDQKNKNNNKIEISNVFMIRRKKDKNENDDPKNPKPSIPNSQPKKINNWNIKSFIPTKTRNQVDDLQDLLKKSIKYKKALMASRIGKYSDKDFKPSHEAILGFCERRDYSLTEAKNFKWLRPEQFFKGPYKVYDQIEADDIMQGGLGDCYFLAAISSIADRKERLERIFLTKKINKEGIYLVALCINGIWEEVVLDDLFPCQKFSKQPAFNHSKSNEIWVMLLEKAWAKIHGGYLNIAAGLTREALRDLTGACAKTYFTSDGGKDLNWKILREAFENKFILTAGSDDLNNGKDDYLEKIGIAGSHAYSLLGVYELSKSGGRYRMARTSSKSNERILKLRNPWGKKEWKGDWNDTSSKWNSQLRQEIGIQVKEDGIFCIGYDYFLKYFSDYQICYYHDNYKYSAIKLRSQKNGIVVFKFSITKRGKYYFCINQKNRRFFKKSERYKYSPLSLLVAYNNSAKKTMKYVGSSIKQDKENWICDDCEIGEYFAYITTPWNSRVDEFSYSVYGPAVTNIEQISREKLPHQFFQKIFSEHARIDKSEKMSKLSTHETYYKRWDDRSGLGYIYFKNNEKSKEIDITVEMMNSRNIKLCEPFKGFRPNFTLKPNEDEIIVYEPSKLPCSAEMRIISSSKNVKNNVKDFAKNQGTKLVRKYKGKDVGVYVYVLKTLDGLIYQYVNTSKFYMLREEISFKLSNCYIESTVGSYIEMIVKPGQEKLISIQKENVSRPYSAKLSHLDYDIRLC